MGLDWKTPLLVCFVYFRFRANQHRIGLTYHLIPANFGVILDVPLNILTPNDRVIVV